MNREIELLRAVEYQLDAFIEGGYFPNAHVLLDTVKELLAQPEPEGVYQKLLRIEDGIEVEILPSELWQDGYETGKRTMQPEQEPVAWKVVDRTTGDFMFSRVKPMKRCYQYDEVIPLYTSPPTREPLSDSDIRTHTPFHYHDAEQKAFAVGVRWAEAQHNITGVDDE